MHSNKTWSEDRYVWWGNEVICFMHFLNQQKGENGCRNDFMINLHVAELGFKPVTPGSAVTGITDWAMKLSDFFWQNSIWEQCRPQLHYCHYTKYFAKQLHKNKNLAKQEISRKWQIWQNKKFPESGLSPRLHKILARADNSRIRWARVAFLGCNYSTHQA